MDPVTAFSLAGTVLQFIDTATRFGALAHSLYQRGSDETGNYESMLKITQDLNAILPDLKPTQTSGGNAREDSLKELAEACEKSATRLVTILSQIVLPNGARRRDALRAAFRAICKEDEIESLQLQLASFRDQLNLHLLIALR